MPEPPPSLVPVYLTVRVAEIVQFAARASGVSESVIVGRAVDALLATPRADDTAPVDPWEEVAVHGTYAGHVVEGRYIPATGRLLVTSGPLTGKPFKSPSGAARACIAAINPDRAATQTNGWTFWHVTGNGARLSAYRGLRGAPVGGTRRAPRTG